MKTFTEAASTFARPNEALMDSYDYVGRQIAASDESDDIAAKCLLMADGDAISACHLALAMGVYIGLEMQTERSCNGTGYVRRTSSVPEKEIPARG